MDVEAGGEGLRPAAGEDNGAGGGGGGEVGEEGGEFVPHSVGCQRWRQADKCFGVWGHIYSALKAFILSGRLISTWATKGRG